MYQGKDIFAALANRMEALPELNVRMYLNIDRPHGDSSPSELLLAKFQKRFRENQWPENMRLPEVFYDPRPLADDDASKSACLHAKEAWEGEATPLNMFSSTLPNPFLAW